MHHLHTPCLVIAVLASSLCHMFLTHCCALAFSSVCAYVLCAPHPSHSRVCAAPCLGPQEGFTAEDDAGADDDIERDDDDEEKRIQEMFEKAQEAARKAREAKLAQQAAGGWLGGAYPTDQGPRHDWVFTTACHCKDTFVTSSKLYCAADGTVQ